MVGDYEVLKAHFLMQIAGLYKRDLPVGWLSTQERQVNFMLLNKEINLAVWDTSKFILRQATQITIFRNFPFNWVYIQLFAVGNLPPMEHYNSYQWMLPLFNLYSANVVYVTPASVLSIIDVSIIDDLHYK